MKFVKILKIPIFKTICERLLLALVFLFDRELTIKYYKAGQRDLKVTLKSTVGDSWPTRNIF